MVHTTRVAGHKKTVFKEGRERLRDRERERHIERERKTQRERERERQAFGAREEPWPHLNGFLITFSLSIHLCSKGANPTLSSSTIIIRNPGSLHHMHILYIFRSFLS